MRLRGHRKAPPRRRAAAFWISFGLLAILLIAALDYRLLDDASDGVHQRRLNDDADGISAYIDDPLIDQPYRHADNKYWIFAHIIVIAYMLLGLNTVCDAYFTGSLDTMVDRWNIKPDVAGATFMAAGGSAPELFTSLIGATISESDVGFGTIVGSAVFNVLFVIGLCGFAASMPIKLTWWPLARDCTFYIFGLSILAIFAKTGKEIELWEACILFALYLCYCTLMYFNESLEARVVRNPVADAVAAGCSSHSTTMSVPVVMSKLPTSDDVLLKLTQVTPASPVGDTGGSSGIEVAPSIDIPSVAPAPAGHPPPLPGTASPRDYACNHNHYHNHYHYGHGDGCDSEPRHHHHHHIKKSQPHFARSTLVGKSIDASHQVSHHGEAATFSGTFSSFLRRTPSHPTQSPAHMSSTPGSQAAGPAWPAPAVVGDTRHKDVEDAKVADDFSDGVGDQPSMKPATEVTGSEAGCGDAMQLDHDEGILSMDEDEEEDDIEALMTMPDGRFAQVVWILSLPIYAPLYYLTPKPTAGCFLVTFGISLLWIAGFSFFLVYCVEVLGEVLRIHIIVMGFTLLAAGTSIPDAVSSVAVARAGEGDMAVSSSIGSNIFDILVGLPVPWIIKIGFVEMIGKGKSHYAVQITSDYIVLYVMILVVMVFCVILSIHCIGWVLNKLLGAGMGLLYVIFLTTVLTVEFQQPDALQF